MDSIVIELQKEALDKLVVISDLLRKALVVAKKLGIEEFEIWLTKELNGYGDDAHNDIPNYRFITGEIKAWNPYHGWQPIFFEEPETEKALSKRFCNQSIAEIESLIGDTKSGTLQMPFSPQSQHQLRKAIRFDTEISLIVSSTSLVRIVDTLRTIVLNWALKLEGEGILGKDLSFTSQEVKAAEKTSYNINNFFGPVQSPQIQQQTSDSLQVYSIQKNDLQSIQRFISELKDHIESLSLNAETKKELIAELKTVEAQAGSSKPKKSIVQESLLSIRKILEGAGSGAGGQLLIKLGEILLG